jgi:site-specific DNA-methyltransferase (adenine-specific)
MTWRVVTGDCLETMRELDDASVHAVVTDPPYHLAFMGRAWDTVSPGQSQREHERWARETLRVLKPGGHLLAFGGTRTYHRLAAGIEDAGFEIRDCLVWLYGSGFPKSLNLDGDWQGWGTALKPAHEPIVVARKPLAGTVAANILEHGTGALNVDGCRIGAGERPLRESDRRSGMNGTYGDGLGGSRAVGETSLGRWPANVVLDPEAAAMLDEQTGELTTNPGTYRRDASDAQDERVAYGKYGAIESGVSVSNGNSGGASRFFYCAKTSSAERNAGLDGFPEKMTRDTYGDGLQGPRPHTADDYEWQRKGARNVHPTVKPIDLMRWLVRLVTPPGGLVLDPFVGSGTTGIATALEGMDFIGLEREEEYVAIARARIAWWEKHAGEGSAAEVLEAAVQRHEIEALGQLNIFEWERA